MRETEDSVVSRSDRGVKKFRLYKLISLTLLVAFLLGGLIFFENDITVENLRYLVKYLDFTSVGDYTDGVKVHYNADSSNRFYVFRGDLAIVNESGITLYDRRGSAVMTDSFTMSDPVCVSGDKYLMVYDLGGHQLRIYNSFALLHEKAFDYQLQSVFVNSSGSYCVVTSEKSYHAAVFVYNNDFKEIQQWLSTDKFAVDAAFSDDGRLIISAIKVQSGELISELIELKIGKQEPLSVYTLADEFPLYLSIDKNGSLLLTDQSLIRVHSGEAKNTASLKQDGLRKFASGERAFAVLQDEMNVGINFSLDIFNREAVPISSHRFGVQIRDIEVYDNTVYVLTHSDLYVIAPDSEMRTYPLDGDFSDFGVLDKTHVILCSDSFAQIRSLS